MIAHIEDLKGKRIHFLGIGGSSMSGFASLLHSQGYLVTGTDQRRSHKTDKLADRGIRVFIGHRPENVHGADLVVFSAAVRPDNCERVEAERLGIPQLERSELIGQLMEGKRFAVGVSGTHGKTTTTSMIAQIFLAAGTDPFIHIGGELDLIGGSTREGHGDDFIIEACEYNASFLKFHPTVAVILNIDEDHLDFYGDIDHIEQAFSDYASLVPEDGALVGWGDDPRVRRILAGQGRSTITYGEKPGNRLSCSSLRWDERGRASYDALLDGAFLCHVDLGVPGHTNFLDSMAALAVAVLRGLDPETAAQALNEFRGAHRRNELTGIVDGVEIYTDYGHNPAEIRSAIEIASGQTHGELWSVWQPHTYSRTKDLFDAFVETFDRVDHLLITEICAAREKDPGDIRSEMLIAPIRARGIDAVLTPSFDDAEAYLRSHWHPGDLVISHGCGDIDLLNEQISMHGDSTEVSE